MDCSKENAVNITTPSGKIIASEIDALIFFRRAKKLDSLDFMLERLAERCKFSHLVTDYQASIQALIDTPVLSNVGYTLAAYQKRIKEIKEGN